MQVGVFRRPGRLAVFVAVLVLSGCGQKGSLYREAEAPDAQLAQVEQTGDNASHRNSEH